jgi:hypothetical protein
VGYYYGISTSLQDRDYPGPVYLQTLFRTLNSIERACFYANELIEENTFSLFSVHDRIGIYDREIIADGI